MRRGKEIDSFPSNAIGSLIGTCDWLARSEIALAEQSNLVLSKSTDNAVRNTSVVEQNQIALLPIMGVDQSRRDTRSLKPVHDFPDFLQIVDHGPVFEMDLADGGGMDLQRQSARDRVLPSHGQDLDLLLLNRRELGVGELQVLRDQTQAV